MFSGSIVAIVTPMRTDGSVDDDALDRLVDFHVDNGTNGIVAVGTTGESPTLSVEEHIGVIRRIVLRAAKRLPVIAGTGANSTSEAIELTELAKEAGADACLLVTPYYNKPTQEGLYQHYRKIAETVDIPLVLYNVPSRTCCDIKPETVERLAAIPNIVGLKEAPTLERNRELLARVGGRIALFSGDDPVACESILAGYQGVISVTANVAPRQVRAVVDAALAGRREEARRLDAGLQQLHKALFVETNPIPVKWAAARLGLIPDGIRLPLVALSRQHYETVIDGLRSAGIAFA
ncbi:dihydrodipicolinate synthase [Steroidobacter denitrificans]|uniref:4-hydroxy-tetrahydrodipicolinate synthase n=1 Tax=Steroidobacter denitrificans TaxID=465721 RepID=A0A127F9Z6_STEDE|nr:4-hydroxy-tetrahydrodipicolinate synthase [Steroidobacter denitrificans]AMN47243.1 dihydrodipicolinate synthase [Steroidobacter denitrificans]